MKKVKLVFFLLTFCLKSTGVIGQDGTVTNQFWIDLNPVFKLTDNLKLATPVGFKTISPKGWNRYFVKPEFQYNWPRLIFKNKPYKEKLIGGVDIYFTDNFYGDNILEIRPFQGYSIILPNRERFQIKNYIKLEERFEINTNSWETTFGLRLRYTAQITLRFQGDFWKQGKGFYMPMNAEFFWNLIGTNQFNDKIRLNIGLGKEFSKVWKAAFFFGYNYSRNTYGGEFHTNDIIYRLRIYKSISRSKKNTETK